MSVETVDNEAENPPSSRPNYASQNVRILIVVNSCFFLAMLGVQVDPTIRSIVSPGDIGKSMANEYLNITTTTTTTESKDSHCNRSSSNVLYGHIHVAKTAGTTLNGKMAMQYERICGNKGYSYDAYQNNERFRTVSMNGKIPVDVNSATGDLYSSLFTGRNRGRVPMYLMQEIGYEDCDWISNETGWKNWRPILDYAVSKQLELELHLPCRDPLDHLMSSCNHRNITFDCSIAKSSRKKLKQEVAKCSLGMGRFSVGLLDQPHTVVKCFESSLYDRYVQYMGTKLEKRRIRADYAHRDTNAERNKDVECVWNDVELANDVMDVLLSKYDYYQFCDGCVGSKMDLLQAAKQAEVSVKQTTRGRQGT